MSIPVVPPEKRAVEYPLTGLKFLIVDDVSATRRVLKRLLNVLDVSYDDIYEATTGAEAFNFLVYKRVDVIITDFHLEDMTGHEILAYVRQSTVHKNCPVIMMTNDLNREDLVKAVDLGVSSYILKPLSVENLSRYVNEALHMAYSGHPSRKATEEKSRLKEGPQIENIPHENVSVETAKTRESSLFDPPDFDSTKK